MILILGLAVIGFILWEEFVSKSTPGTIANYASNAGFTGPDLIIAVAIAYAESAGNPNAVGDNGDSIGLWQIDTRYHPEYDAASLTDPQTNANAAFAIYQAAGNSFQPWSTFNSGAYQSFLGQANTETGGTSSADNSLDSTDLQSNDPLNGDFNA